MELDTGTAAADAADRAARELTGAARTAGERTMGAIAQQALFTEALLGAIKARVEELKAVAK